MISLKTPIYELHNFLPRVGVRTAQLLASAVASFSYRSNINEATVEDLLLYLPMRYEDRSNLSKISDLVDGVEAAVAVEVRVAGTYTVGKGKYKLFEISATDETGRIRAYWWNQQYLEKVFLKGSNVILYGLWKYDTYRNTLAVENPEYEMVDDDSDGTEIHMGRRVPIYRKLGEIRTKQLRTIIYRLFEHLDLESFEDFLPEDIRKRNHLPDLVDAIKQLHFPIDDASLDIYNRTASPAHRRVIFEEFFWLMLGLAVKRTDRQKEEKGTVIEINSRTRQSILNILPFKPTDAQKRVLKEIAEDMTSDHPMNRLLQGDVGSGKTIVAAQTIVLALENGYQAALMVPTEILAEQHTRNLKKLFSKTSFRVELLIGSLPAKEKRKLQAAIKEGEVDLAIGTHALIQESVEFSKLGLVVIDEQHRFGVLQRGELMRRGYKPDVLVMTATPIPRSLAMTVYGDLDISIIDQMPPGRTPIETFVRTEDARSQVYNFVHKEILKGRQCYTVYPLIEESEKLDLLAATKMADKLQREVFPNFKIGLLHGRMKASEKEEVMGRFISAEIQILVSTTVIEVGVDVPNASVMIVEHAERFGLSQLHQLRGRVGRGAAQSYCILMTAGPKSKEASERLKVMEQTSDGFKIAEKDLEIRGPGEVMGTRQSGEQVFRIANIVRDRNLLEAARKEAEFLLNSRSDIGNLIEKVRRQPRFSLARIG